jgi:hypothetical protein
VNVTSRTISAATVVNRLVLYILCTFFAAASAVSQFEGVISMKVAMRNGDSLESGWYRLSVRGNLLRTDLTDAQGAGSAFQGAFIYRGDTHTLSMINRADKSCTDIRLKPQEASQAATAPGSNLKPTGKTDQLLGYPCDEFTVVEEGRISRILATKKFGGVYGGLARAFSTGGGGVAEADWSADLAALGYFPLRIVTTAGDVTEQIQEVTAVQPGAVPDSCFAPPAGYTRTAVDFDLGKILQGMGGDNSTGADTSDTTGHH